jgi:alpha-D-ribose 1-methylphosphonate 5-phosphate C-P lyase
MMRIMRHSNDDLVALAIIQYRIPPPQRLELPLSTTWCSGGAISVACPDTLCKVACQGADNKNVTPAPPQILREL